MGKHRKRSGPVVRDEEETKCNRCEVVWDLSFEPGTLCVCGSCRKKTRAVPLWSKRQDGYLAKWGMKKNRGQHENTDEQEYETSRQHY